MKNKRLIKTVILAVAAFVLAAILIAGNVILDYYSLIINRFIVGDTVDSSGAETQDALKAADGVVREAAEESIVLLKNDNNFLPLTNLAKVNLFGYGSTDAGLLLTGGGSGGTTITDTLENGKPRIKVDLTDAFKEAGVEYNSSLVAEYEKFNKFDADYRSGGSTGANAVDSLINPAASFYTDELMTSAKSFSSTAVAVLSRWGAENGGNGELKNIGKYTNGSFLELTPEERAMFVKLEEKNFDVIVLLNVCNNMELGFLEEFSCIKACLHIGIPGQSGAAAIPEILKGEVNPSGRMSNILPYDYQTNNPVYVNAAKNGSDLTYQEGIYFGYKWYETADADGNFAGVDNKYGRGYDGVVQFPFGYGPDADRQSTYFTENRISKNYADGVSVFPPLSGWKAGEYVAAMRDIYDRYKNTEDEYFKAFFDGFDARKRSREPYATEELNLLLNGLFGYMIFEPTTSNIVTLLSESEKSFNEKYLTDK